MALLEDMLKTGNLATGLAVGVGLAVLAPVIRPMIRPVAKSVIKAGLIAYDQGRTALTTVGEGAEEVISEARSEMGRRDSASEPEANQTPEPAPSGKRKRRASSSS